ncbi:MULTISPECIES: cation:proton antiporter [unclassified Halomonas]|uniref:cation:proton antiporter domain-containing protein n=1 Tax=unclassified Halomonas TaxID=2609666 RepID=UPI0024694A72|nr:MULTISPECIES: cation:proton antiporter [unclassified Halomonas]
MTLPETLSWLPVDPSVTAASLLLLGVILSISILADVVASRTRLPRISLLVLVGVGVAVGAGLLALGFPIVVAVSLAAISVATDPAAVQETVRASGDTRLRARLLLGIVAIDDGWGIVVFELAMAMRGFVRKVGSAKATYALTA